MSKAGKKSARLVIRRIGGVRACKRLMLSDDTEPATREFLKQLLARYNASVKRQKAREARAKRLPGGIPPAKVVQVTYCEGKEIRKLVPAPVVKTRGFTDPLLTRDGVAAPAPRKKRKSPRQPFSGWRTAP